MCEEKPLAGEKALTDEALEAVTGGEGAPKAPAGEEWKPKEGASFWDDVRDYFGLTK